MRRQAACRRTGKGLSARRDREDEGPRSASRDVRGKSSGERRDSWLAGLRVISGQAELGMFITTTMCKLVKRHSPLNIQQWDIDFGSKKSSIGYYSNIHI